MIRQNLDLGWTLSQGRGRRAPGQKPEIVNLPHDWAIGQDTDPKSPGAGGNGFYPGAALQYGRAVEIPAAWAGQRVLLALDGAYRNSEVAINNQYVTYHAYGYTPFFADLTPYVRFGESNQIQVTVNNSALPNTRWYSGTGLYRHVELLCLPQVSVKPWGLFPVTESLDEELAVLRVEITAENHTGTQASRTGRVTLTDAGGETVISGYTQVQIPASGEATGFVRLAVMNPHAWDLDTPYLYQVTAELLEDGNVTDSASVTTGLRTVSVDPVRGFRLNGRSMKLRGGCIHHDNGPLGAAAFDAAEERRVRLMKEGGFNAIRCAHNPPSRGLLEACDKLGMLVMDEAFDMWIAGKNANDYHLDFQQWWAQDIDAMVLRDRAHPSVVMWSIGNEIPEHNGSSDGWRWSQKLAERVRLLDTSRPVTSAVNNVAPPFDPTKMVIAGPGGAALKNSEKKEKPNPTVSFFNNEAMRAYNDEQFLAQTEGYVAPLDVIGYNYMEYLYEKTLELYPERVLCGTESFPLDADLNWNYVQSHPQIIGDFTWTSWDYLGEAGLGRSFYLDPNYDGPPPFLFGAGYPWRISYDAEFDICGYPRPQLAYRQIVWGCTQTYAASRDPKFHGWEEKIAQWAWPLVHHHWSWPGCEGMTTTLEVYSAADEVELLINGVSQGRQPAGAKNRFKAEFTVTYQPGKLEAVSYTAGQEISRDVLTTTGAPAKLALLPETKTLRADGEDLCYVQIEVQDAEDNRVPTAELPLTAEVAGAATLQAFGSPKPDSTERFTVGGFTTYEGRVLAILRAGTAQGTATLTVRGELGEVTLELPVE